VHNDRKRQDQRQRAVTPAFGRGCCTNLSRSRCINAPPNNVDQDRDPPPRIGIATVNTADSRPASPTVAGEGEFRHFAQQPRPRARVSERGVGRLVSCSGRPAAGECLGDERLVSTDAGPRDRFSRGPLVRADQAFGRAAYAIARRSAGWADCRSGDVAEAARLGCLRGCSCPISGGPPASGRSDPADPNRRNAL
jgi:hypothetical protein